jgi:hypothetical protein
MKRIATCGITLIGWSLFAPVSQAQFSRPAVSPYINLTRGGNPALNYYGLVRPQTATNTALQSLGSGLNAVGSTINSTVQGPPQTGNRSSFMTHRRFFMNNGGANTGSFGGAPGGAPGGQRPGGQGAAGQSQSQRRY